MTIEQEILNAAADDWESLEQIYRLVSLEFSADNYDPENPNSYYWRERQPPVLLANIADAVPCLVQSGLLTARREDGTVIMTMSGNDLWHCWFRVSDAGRAALIDPDEL